MRSLSTFNGLTLTHIIADELGSLRGGGLSGGAALGDLALSGSLVLVDALLEESAVGSSISLALLQSSDLLLDALSLSAESDGSDKALDVGALGVLLAVLLLDLARDDILADIISLGEVEELADLGGTLGAEALRHGGVGDTLDLVVALLHDDEVEHRQIGADDAAADRLALSLTSAASAVAGEAVLEEEAHAGVGEHTLLHGEALLVVTASDLEDLKPHRIEH
eukprot:scaffold3808_cov170-Ochromonas_danica.AAC.8